MDLKEQLIEFIRLNLDDTETKEEFMKKLFEFMEYICDEEVDEDELTSESSDEEEDDSQKEKISYTIDKNGFYKLN